MRSYEMSEIGHRGLEECLTEAFGIATDARGEASELRVARQTVFHDSERPSRLLLPAPAPAA